MREGEMSDIAVLKLEKKICSRIEMQTYAFPPSYHKISFDLLTSGSVCIDGLP